MPAAFVDGELARGPQEGVALSRVRRPREVRGVDARGLDRVPVVIQGDGIPQLRNAPQLSFARVKVDDGLLPLLVVRAHGVLDVHEVSVVGVLRVIRGVDPVDVGHVARGDVERQAVPVAVPGNHLDFDVDFGVLLVELLEGLPVGGRGLLVPHAEGQPRSVRGVRGGIGRGAGGEGERRCRGQRGELPLLACEESTERHGCSFS